MNYDIINELVANRQAANKTKQTSGLLLQIVYEWKPDILIPSNMIRQDADITPPIKSAQKIKLSFVSNMLDETPTDFEWVSTTYGITVFGNRRNYIVNDYWSPSFENLIDVVKDIQLKYSNTPQDDPYNKSEINYLESRYNQFKKVDGTYIAGRLNDYFKHTPENYYQKTFKDYINSNKNAVRIIPKFYTGIKFVSDTIKYL